MSHEGIRKAFRDKAKQFHPDKFRDPGLQQEASNRFILARKASDFLLALPVEAINHARYRTSAEPVVRRTRRAPTPAPKVVDQPIIEDLDNIARLFHFVGSKGIPKSFWNRLMKINISPGALLGGLYERFIERKYTAEKRLNGFAYAVFKLLRIVVGSLFLIASFLFVSVGGFAVMMFLAPAGLAFIIVYSGFTAIVPDRKDAAWDTKVGAALLTPRLLYLMVKTTILVIIFLFTQPMIHVFRASFYLSGLTWVFLILMAIPALSVIYEWIAFFRSKPA